MDYKTYENQLMENYKYNPIDIEIGFYALCSYQPQAWNYVFESVRKYYPNEPIILFNDGIDQYDYSEIAKKYNCIYIKKDRNICLLWNNLEDAYEFLSRTSEACKILEKYNKEWIIHLHPDVICNGKISYYPPGYLCGVSAGSNTGKSNNNFNNSPEWKNIETYIINLHPNLEINGWGWCGGSIMNIPIFNKVYENVLKSDETYKLETLAKIYKESVKYEDTMIPILFMINGFYYRIWKDNPEYHRGEQKGAFLHGYKEHYDFKKAQLSLEDFNKLRIMQANPLVK
jgi:hypothetical protein